MSRTFVSNAIGKEFTVGFHETSTITGLLLVLAAVVSFCSGRTSVRTASKKSYVDASSGYGQYRDQQYYACVLFLI